MKGHGSDVRHNSIDGVVRIEAIRLHTECVSVLGGDPEKLLRQEKIDPATLTHAGATISYRSVINLLEWTASELKGPDFGLKLATRQNGAYGREVEQTPWGR